MRAETADERYSHGAEAHAALADEEPIELIYTRVLRVVRPRTPLPDITVRYCQYANANSRIQLRNGLLSVHLSDVFEDAPGAVHEALAHILVGKLFRCRPEPRYVARYRRYLSRSDVRRSLHLVKQTRGRKVILDPRGRVYDLCELFEDLNEVYFGGLMARPQLGWSVRTSRTVLGHYDPSHHAIVLNSLLDSPRAPGLAVRYVLFHEMLHLRYPVEHHGWKRCVHTPAFKEAERRFENFHCAKAELKKFVEESADGRIGV